MGPKSAEFRLMEVIRASTEADVEQNDATSFFMKTAQVTKCSAASGEVVTGECFDMLHFGGMLGLANGNLCVLPSMMEVETGKLYNYVVLSDTETNDTCTLTQMQTRRSARWPQRPRSRWQC